MDKIEELKKLAESGDANALYSLGMCYYEGFCVDKDTLLARQMFVKASAKNHQPSIEALKRLFNMKVFNCGTGFGGYDF